MAHDLNQSAIDFSKDLLSGETRNARKSIFVTAIIGLLVAWGEITPNQAKVFEIELPNLTATKVLTAFSAILFFQLLAFVIYMIPDWLHYRHLRDKFKHTLAVEDLNSRVPPDQEEYDALHFETSYREDHAPWRWGPKAAAVRAFWDFFVPVLCGVVALSIMVWYAVSVAK